MFEFCVFWLVVEWDFEYGFVDVDKVDFFYLVFELFFDVDLVVGEVGVVVEFEGLFELVVVWGYGFVVVVGYVGDFLIFELVVWFEVVEGVGDDFFFYVGLVVDCDVGVDEVEF